jgi:cyclic beta-1,2-glucan glucanotransferase
MKPTASGWLARLLNGPPPEAFLDIEEPIRAEIFGVERLEQHAESLAAAQRVTTRRRRGRHIAPRVKENHRVLIESYRTLWQSVREGRAITPAAEWLVDNFHIVDEQIREIHSDLPPSFYRELPKLREGHLEGFPRVLGMAWAFVAHSDSRFDPAMLRRFVESYQRVATAAFHGVAVERGDSVRVRSEIQSSARDIRRSSSTHL